LAVLLAFKLFDEPLEGFFGRLAGGKTNPLKTQRKRLHPVAYSYSFYLFNPGKMMLVPDSSQPGKAGNWGSMSALTSRRFIEKDVKELTTPRSTYGHLSNKFKNEQHFFTQKVNY
jgi:hypothetical protein